MAGAKPASGRRVAREDRQIIIACDEFAAILDRVTAFIVARCVQKLIDSNRRVCAILATSHQDLIRPLAPDIFVECDFARIKITRR